MIYRFIYNLMDEVAWGLMVFSLVVLIGVCLKLN